MNLKSLNVYEMIFIVTSFWFSLAWCLCNFLLSSSPKVIVKFLRVRLIVRKYFKPLNPLNRERLWHWMSFYFRLSNSVRVDNKRGYFTFWISIVFHQKYFPVCFSKWLHIRGCSDKNTSKNRDRCSSVHPKVLFFL